MAPTKAKGLEGDAHELIRVDSNGRCRYSEEFKREAVAAFGRSGLSGMQFARQCGVKYSTFAYWVKRSREAGVQSFAVAEIEDVFESHEARPEQPPPPPPAAQEARELAVELPGGGVARVGTPGGVDLLSRLLRGLVS